MTGPFYPIRATEPIDRRDYKQEYNALADALVGNSGLSAITEASKHATMRAAMAALKSFPLPSQGATSVENYRRILSWLHGKPDVAALIIDLEFGATGTIDALGWPAYWPTEWPNFYMSIECSCQTQDELTKLQAQISEAMQGIGFRVSPDGRGFIQESK